MRRLTAWVSCLALLGYVYHQIATRTKRLGTTEDGVSAYASSDYLLKEINHVTWQGQQILSGRRWECVEFARRYIIQTKGILFKDVGRAEEIWDMTTFFNLRTKSDIPCKHYRVGETMPQRGDLLVWAASEDMPFGHVAVIVQANGTDKRGAVKIAEQNWDDWVAPHYSRMIHLANSPYLLGIIRI